MKHDVHHYIKMAFGNKQHIEQADTCGCYFCGRIFKPTEVKNYITEPNGKGETAECPFCFIDSVIDNKRVADGGEVLSEELLMEVNHKAF